MYRFISETFHRLVDELKADSFRYLYKDFDLRNRLTGLVGARGVGKTTLFLQYIKNKLPKEKAFYFSADLVYFQQASLLEFVGNLHQREGYQTIFIDEIHKYQGWNQELKNLYDSFPSLQIVFSGSSMLDLVHGSYDLSRRAKLYRLHGLSFREFINFSIGVELPSFSMDEICNDTLNCLQKIKDVPRLLPLFEEYLKQGYYPFVFEDPHSYHEKVTRVIDKTIFEDISNYYNLKTPNLQSFKKILTYISSIPPGDVNTNNIAKHLELDNKTVDHYVTILANVGLIRKMAPFEGGGAGLRRSGKVFMNNTTLMHTMQQYLGQPISKGTERELFFAQSLLDGELELFQDKNADYRTHKAIFEVGGKNKTNKQLKGAQLPAYIVKDDILHPLKGEIPLFLFGFLY